MTTATVNCNGVRAHSVFIIFYTKSIQTKFSVWFSDKLYLANAKIEPDH